MSFTEQDKRILIEVINHIHHAYASDEAFRDNESTNITLPARLVRLSADVVGESYRAELLGSLQKPAIELLVNTLFKSIDAMRVSLRAVMTALPNESSEWIRAQFEQQIDSFERLKDRQQSPTPALIEAPSTAELNLTELVTRQHELSEANEVLSKLDVKQLSDEVSRLEATIGTRRQQVEDLQSTVASKTAELEKLTSAAAAAQNMLQGADAKANEQLELVLNITDDLVTALDRYIARKQSKIREAVDAVAEKVSEGKRLKAELQARINEVSEAFGETLNVAAALSSYTEANQRVGSSVPTVIDTTKEKLRRVEEELREIDEELKSALSQHQSARHVLEMAHV